MPIDASALPADPATTAALAARGLRTSTVGAGDDAAVRAWTEADQRGFHGPAPTAELAAELRASFPAQRTVGVHDDTLAEPDVPVATVASWPAPLTLPGGEVDAWAVSAVTVAPTHRRRGIARAMLEGELRTAVALGLPAAVLTVSEATLYGRYGFGPATWAVDVEVDVRRAGWAGGEVPGRVQLVGRETALATARELLAEVRRATPGDVGIVGHRFERLFGSRSDDEGLRARRFARYDDADGRPRGLLVHRVSAAGEDFTTHTAAVLHLAAATADAHRALWRYLLSLDLVATVTASLVPVDDPLRWLVADPRRVRTTAVRDHLWVRVLDPAALLSARGYGAPGRVSLRVADPLGHADGAVTVDVGADGRAAVTAGEAADGPLLELGVDVLGSLALGGASAVVLAAAGRVVERSPGDAAAADRLLRAERAPVLTTWF